MRFQDPKSNYLCLALVVFSSLQTLGDIGTRDRGGLLPFRQVVPVDRLDLTSYRVLTLEDPWCRKSTYSG